jgi:prolyl-tRNA synthetase
MLINQWANVVRWELRPRLFLRTTEFLWQEGHTCHATYEDARDYTAKILTEVYADLMINVLAMPVLPGRKTARERFPGAINTLTCEAMMGDGKALQMGTSHELGQNFAKAFDTKYSAASGQLEYVWQTSWGTSTRMVGGLIMTHGDDAGLRIPPVLAPVQVVVLLVKAEGGAPEAAAALTAELRAAGVRVELDDRVDTSFGRRAIEWELKGVPLRIEIGPRDLANGELSVVNRINGDKQTRSVSGVAAEIPSMLSGIQRDMLAAATEARDARIVDVATVDEAAEAAQTGFGRIAWSSLGLEGESKLRESAITVRCLRNDDGSLPDGDDDPRAMALVARAY